MTAGLVSGGSIKIALAQLDLLVGDVQGNLARVLAEAQRAGARGAQLVVFPELALSGYPPEDLLFHRGLRAQVEQALDSLEAAVATGPELPAVLLGYPEYEGQQGAPRIYNAASLLHRGSPRANYRKICLPNYRVFDEKRYFTAGNAAKVVELHGFRIGLLVCEDIWEPDPARAAQAAGAELLVIINASPYEQHKQRERETLLRSRVDEVRLPVVYVNLVGGQDELVFDGNSFVMDAAGKVVLRAQPFEEASPLIEFRRDAAGRAAPHTTAADVIAPELRTEESVYRALVLGVRDYVGKHAFPGVIMGLSGGVDSSLTLAIAVDALGADRVQVVMMPSRYTSQMSRDDAEAQARTLGVAYSVISIEDMFAATLAALAAQFAGRKPDTTEENIQARCRGLLLMAISNKTGRMLLTTGNKSEMAVGYATLYGDMNGGFAPIKDCSKLLVYRLAKYRNELCRTRGEYGGADMIPARVIEREPSAELRHDQKDTDSLPPYEVLDAILEAFIEEDLSVDEIVARGFDRAVVGRVLDMVKRNEYKRRQAPPGIRVSGRAFGRDWRYPITSGYRR
ncbi:MAG TPA: NAD+ synthase [Steroidobacteraceae bacterium]|nr:NAD+ synthase [Steroidobacteraceae bacterium]